jgi:hypothetical protein
MNSQKIIAAIVAQFDGVVPRGSWGETSLSYSVLNASQRSRWDVFSG